MRYYLAPMEGITTYVFRKAYQKIYRPMDKYFTPFIVPHKQKGMSEREWGELNPEHNAGMYVIPQILTNDADDFIKTAKMLYGYGYKEVNLNLGCPSKTVVSKGRGSGFLEDPMKLDRFFDRVFQSLGGENDIKVSVKTRIGLESPLEFEDLLKVYNKYPLSELIIHPRLQTDYYKNHPNWEIFKEALESSEHSICYNGDIFSLEDFHRFTEAFPQVERVMLGRGVVAYPDLLEQLEGLSSDESKYKKLRQFHEELLNGYKEIMSGDRNVLFKMKEFWSYCQHNFPEQPKLWKKVKKCEKLDVYRELIDEIFETER